VINPDVLDAMVASGCTAEQIAAVVKAACAAEAQAVEARREKDRVRKRAERAAARVAEQGDCPAPSEMSGGHLGHPRTGAESTDSADTVSLSPVPLLSPAPPNNPLTPNPIPKTNSRGTRLPENHTMSGPDLAYALSKGMTDREAGDLFERFCSWAWSASGPNAVKRNWHQAWQGWVQREVKDRPRGRPPPVSTGRPLTEFQRKQAETNDVRAQLRSAAMGGSSGGTADGVLSDDHGERSGAVRDSPGSTLLLLPEETR
jgi:hypothetical protein